MIVQKLWRHRDRTINTLGVPERRHRYPVHQPTTFVGVAAGRDEIRAHFFTLLFSITESHFEKISYGLGLPTRDSTSCQNCIAKAHRKFGGSPSYTKALTW